MLQIGTCLAQRWKNTPSTQESDCYLTYQHGHGTVATKGSTMTTTMTGGGVRVRLVLVGSMEGALRGKARRTMSHKCGTGVLEVGGDTV